MSQNMNFSFAGCGFLGIYHVGVAACLKKYAPNLLVNRISGASAGALAAVCLLCNAPLGIITSSVLKTATEARKRFLGPFNPLFNVEKLLREGLLSVLPDDAHERVNGKLFISVTRVSDGKNVLLSHFTTREELVQALLCSAFIPGFSGWKALTIKGVRYVDGGFSDNLPQLDENTITISPFCGEADICPKDINAGILTISLANTSIELSRENLYRFALILFPPPPEILNRMCQQGFNDTLDFLQRNRLINCTRCLAVHSTFNMEEKKVPVDVDFDYDGDPAELYCKDCDLHQQEAILDSLPEAVGSILQDAIDKANLGLTNWVFKHKSMKLISIISLPWVLPIEIAFAACMKFLKTASSVQNFKTMSLQIIQLVKVLLRSWTSKTSLPPHHHHPRHHHHENKFSCQLAITEFSGDGELSLPSDRRQSFDLTIDLSDVDHVPQTHKDAMALETEALSQLALRCAARSISRTSSRYPSRAASRPASRAVSRVVSRIPSLENLSIDSPEWDDVNHHISEDTFDQILSVTNDQDALMAYYYMDDNNKMKVTEIFDMSEGVFDEEINELRQLQRQHLSEGVLQSHLESFRDIMMSEGRKVSDIPKIVISRNSSLDGSMSEPEADQHAE